MYTLSKLGVKYLDLELEHLDLEREHLDLEWEQIYLNVPMHFNVKGIVHTVSLLCEDPSKTG